MPSLSSDTGRHVWPANIVLPDTSSSETWSRRRASSGTVNGNSNTSSHDGIQLSSIVFVFFFFLSAGTPTIAIYSWRLCKSSSATTTTSLRCGTTSRSLPLHENPGESRYRSVYERNHSTILRPYIQSPVSM